MGKTCFKCSRELPLGAFYRHKGMADGRLNKCKTCTKADANRYRADNLERVQAYDRARANQPHRVAARDAYQQTEQGRVAARRAKRAYIERNPERRRAHNATNNAVRDGRLVKSDACERCGGKSRLHGHHDDYSRPLNVVWLCTRCHREVHASER